jgi:hypothetical protein
VKKETSVEIRRSGIYTNMRQDPEEKRKWAKKQKNA